MTLNRIIAGILAVGIYAGGLSAGMLGIAVVNYEPASVQRVALQEDDPGWNCTNQGNNMCGVRNAYIAHYNEHRQIDRVTLLG